MNIPYKAYCGLSAYRENPLLRAHHVAANEGKGSPYVYREISVLLYPDGIELRLQSVGEDAFEDGWSTVKPLDVRAIKLDLVAEEDDQELAQFLASEADDVSNKVKNMLKTFRARREVFAPVFAINVFAF